VSVTLAARLRAALAMRHRLGIQLLAWTLTPLLGVLAFNLYIGYGQSRAMANLVTDNMLRGSARVIAEAVHVDAAGNIAVDVPPAALEIFDTGQQDLVYYKVVSVWGSLVAGSGDLPQPATMLEGQEMTLRDATVRAVAIEHPIVGLGEDGAVAVTVAVTLRGEHALWRRLWLSQLRDQMLLVAVAGLVALLGLRRGLAPILRLRDRVLASRRDRLVPFDPASVQTELQPLVHALNGYMGRVQQQMEAQRRFVANAAHQLRTPLTLLATQAGVAAREGDPVHRQEALGALTRSTRHATRLAEQLLTLTRAEPGSRAPRAERIGIADAARKVLESRAAEALARGMDLALEAPDEVHVTGDGTMLKEMVVNLVDNALRYTPPPGELTVAVTRAGDEAVLTVEDSGPGIPHEDRNLVFERFYRVIGTQAEGSGLGLAIVREVVVGAGGRVELTQSRHGGLGVRVTLPASDTKAG